MNFDSGWEWGYWLSDVVTARASWDPMLSPLVTTANKAAAGEHKVQEETENCVLDNEECESSDENDSKLAGKQDFNFVPGNTSRQQTGRHTPCAYKESDDQWKAFASALQPITRIFGPIIGPKVKEILVLLARKQADLLIFGRVGGKESPNLKKLTGFAYMSGDDTWVDLPRLFGLSFLQPDKVRLARKRSTQKVHRKWMLLYHLLPLSYVVVSQRSYHLPYLLHNTSC